MADIVWVCVDCMLARECGEPTETADREPWGEIPTVDVGMGLDCGIPHHWEEHSDDHSENFERQEFSWSQCDACGSTLGGTRYAYTVFNWGE